MLQLLKQLPRPRPRVLVADDDPSFRHFLCEAFAGLDVELLQACDGVEALQLGLTQPIDLALVDLQMPALDGFGVCRALREHDSQLPILVVTGETDAESIRRSFEAGGSDFIRKPINASVLRERMRGWLLRQHEQQALRDLSRLALRGLNAGQVGFLWHDAATGRLSWDQGFLPQVGLSEAEVADAGGLFACVQSGDRLALQRLLDGAAEAAALRIRLQVGPRTHDWTLHALPGYASAAGRLLAVQDVSDVARLSRDLEHERRFDALTGLPKRHEFGMAAQALIERQRIGDAPPVLLAWINVSRFARFNTTYGEAVANDLLAAIAQRLQKAPHTASQYLVGRIGSDKFGVALTAPTEATARAALDAVLGRFDYFFTLEHHRLNVAITCGHVWCAEPGPRADVETFLGQAQRAQQKARAMGVRSQAAQVETNRLAGWAARGLDLEGCLNKALDEQQFFLVYQPQHAFDRQRIVGCEALLRWRHPLLGTIPPNEFIPALEDTGLIHPVGRWVIDQAFQQAATWARTLPQPVRVAINLSPHQLFDPDLGGYVAAALLRHGVSPALIEFEITESAMTQDIELALQTAETLRQLGFGLAVDDFGVGNSSLQHILRFPISTLKIDKSFIDGIADGAKNRAIVGSVVSMAKALDVEVVAEGVEVAQQLDFVEALGVESVQGYLIGKPMSSADFERTLQACVLS